MKKSLRGALVAGAAALLTLGLTGAHAGGVSVAITTPADATILNAPGTIGCVADGVCAPAQTIDGTESGATLVVVDLSSDLDERGGSADITCDAHGAKCTWSYLPPFAMVPGNYTVTVTATDDLGNSSSATSTVTIV